MMSHPRVVYLVDGREYDNERAALVAFSRAVGRQVTEAHWYEVTTMQDAAAGRMVYIGRASKPDDTQAQTKRGLPA